MNKKIINHFYKNYNEIDLEAVEDCNRIKEEYKKI